MVMINFLQVSKIMCHTDNDNVLHRFVFYIKVLFSKFPKDHLSPQIKSSYFFTLCPKLI